MYRGEEYEYPWNLPDHLGKPEETSTSDNDSQHQEDRAEMEAMLYGQIYFEQNEDTKQEDLEYDVVVEDKTSKSTDEVPINSTFATMVNFSGRSHMSPAVSEKTKKLEDRGASREEDEKWRQATATKAKSALKKLLAKITGTNVDGDEEIKPSRKSKKKKDKVVDLSDRNTDRKRKSDKTSSTVKHKVKKSDIIVLDSSTDVYQISDSESDSDLIMLNDEDMDDLDLETNIKGDWRTFRDPERLEKPDLRTVDIATWDGSPSLTIREVRSLLSACDWRLADDDRYGLTRSYGRSRTLDCRNCRQMGHIAGDCPKPKRVTCILCGESHSFRRCKNKLCYNCDKSGHESKKCQEARRPKHVTCNRCGYKGHWNNICPDLWREYHLTTKPGRLVLKEQKENKAAYCYNCGERGHFGYDCQQERISYHCKPTAPFSNMTHAQRHQYERDNKIKRTPLDKKKKNITSKQKPQKRKDKYRELMGSSASLNFESKNTRNSKKKNQKKADHLLSTESEPKKPSLSKASKWKKHKTQKAEKLHISTGSIFDTEPKSSGRKNSKEKNPKTSQNKKSQLKPGKDVPNLPLHKMSKKKGKVKGELSISGTGSSDKCVGKAKKKMKQIEVSASASGRKVKFAGVERGFKMTTGTNSLAADVSDDDLMVIEDPPSNTQPSEIISLSDSELEEVSQVTSEPLSSSCTHKQQNESRTGDITDDEVILVEEEVPLMTTENFPEYIAWSGDESDNNDVEFTHMSPTLINTVTAHHTQSQSEAEFISLSSRRSKKKKKRKTKVSRGDVSDADLSDVILLDEDGPIRGTGLIPGVVPWWENDLDKEDVPDFQDQVFQSILSGTFHHMTSGSKSNFKSRLTRTLTSEEYSQEPSGSQRYKKKMSRAGGGLRGRKQKAHNFKERTKHDNEDSVPAVPVPLLGDPIPDSNLGSRLLQSMGWQPGTGLGADGSGMTDPITVYVRPRRRGFGEEK